MNDFEILSKIGTDAVLRLRKTKLAAGQTFMINSNELSSKESYLEYPDGTINIVTVAPDSRSFLVIRKLSDEEAQSIRTKFDLQ